MHSMMVTLVDNTVFGAVLRVQHSFWGDLRSKPSSLRGARPLVALPHLVPGREEIMRRVGFVGNLMNFTAAWPKPLLNKDPFNLRSERWVLMAIMHHPSFIIYRNIFVIESNRIFS